CYLGYHSGVARVSPTGVSPSVPTISNVFGYPSDFLLPAGSAAPAEWSRYPDHATPAGYDTWSVWPVPCSLTTTKGIAVAFSSCGYCDVSLPHLSSTCPMCSGRGDEPLRPPGFPIRKSPDLSLVADSPGLIAGSYVLLRLLVPRHPPCALINLATTDDARVHCAVLKIRSV